MKIITRPWRQILTREVLWSATAILVYLALVKLIIHLLTANNYGYFVDEFYWLDMAQHLDFGYVDVPPLVVYVGAAWRFLFGASLFAIRILPALAGAAMVFFAGLLAREMGLKWRHNVIIWVKCKFIFKQIEVRIILGILPALTGRESSKK